MKLLFFILGYVIIISASDLQPSTAIVNQLPGVVLDLSVKT